MDLNKNCVEKLLQNLKTAEIILDTLIAEVDALRQLTDKNGPLNKALDEALQMTYNKKLPSRTCKKQKNKRRRVTKKMGKPRQSESM